LEGPYFSEGEHFYSGDLGIIHPAMTKDTGRDMLAVKG